MTRTAAAALAMAACAAAACSSAPEPVQLSDEWPARAGDYDDVTDRWTRMGRIVKNYDKVLEVYATFKSPEWRAAYVSRRARTEKMSKAARSELAAAERAEAQEIYEVQLVVATYRYEEDDLSRGEQSIWRIVLVDDNGNEIRPLEIKKDRRPFEVVRAYFPHLTEQHTPYIARFPRSVNLLGKDARRFKLVMGSSRGGVELVWQSK